MKLYVAGTGGSDVYVIDVATNTVSKTLKVGKQPHGIAATRARDSRECS
jgi:YVTN family beta-propeller protein